MTSRRLLPPASPAARRARRQRGFTLVELMVTSVVMLMVVGGAMYFLIFQTRMQNATQVRSSLLADGQAAMAILERELALAGFGLPRRLVIKELPSGTDLCSGNVKMTVASLDPLRQWSAPSSDTGVITLGAAAPSPGSAGAPDHTVPAGSWLFLFRHNGVGTPESGEHGHGLARVADDRPPGTASFTVHATNDFSSAQPKLELGAAAPINRAGLDGRDMAVLEARVTTVGVSCEGGKAFLYLERAGGARVPLVSTVTDLRFSFLVDVDADGEPDDQNSDGKIDEADLLPTLILPGTLKAVHVILRVRSDEKDSALDPPDYRYQAFSELIQTPNIHTERDTFMFIDNSGI